MLYFRDAILFVKKEGQWYSNEYGMRTTGVFPEMVVQK